MKKIVTLMLLLAITCVSIAWQKEKQTRYKSVVPIFINNKNDFAIDGNSIKGGPDICIHLRNCNRVTITNCKLVNSKSRGILLENCGNVTITKCHFEDDSTGVYAVSSNHVKVDYNYFHNTKASAVQFNDVSGGGNTISYNKIKIDIGTGNDPNPHVGDLINLYKSNGLPDDNIKVYNNLLKGGGSGIGARGMAGIVAGDVGGSYQDIENNRLVNTGYVGIQQQGGHHIKIKYNYIYGDALYWSGLGLGSANYSGRPATDNEISHNSVNWLSRVKSIGGKSSGGNIPYRRDTAYKPGAGENRNEMPKGWTTNQVNVTTLTSKHVPDF